MATLPGYRCAGCNSLYLPPMPQCPKCGGVERTEVSMNVEGTVRAWTTIHIAPARYAGEAPYTVVLVELDEGPRLMGRLAVGERTERGNRVRCAGVDKQRGATFTGIS